MDDDIIDLTSYGDAPEGSGGSFALWGAGGERSRFALPVWRATFILDGDRGALAWSSVDDPEASLRTFFVLDLERQPARTDLSEVDVGPLADRGAPAVRMDEGTAVILLGSERGRIWWLVVTGVADAPPPAEKREDLLFLAGECAGLLTRRGLGEEIGEAE